MSILKEKSFKYALEIIEIYKQITTEKKEFILSKQLLRSGTAIGALVREANNAESKMDFVHKLAIAQKECDETIYWLELLCRSGYLDGKLFDVLRHGGNELLLMLKSSIITVKKKLGKL